MPTDDSANLNKLNVLPMLTVYLTMDSAVVSGAGCMTDSELKHEELQIRRFE